MRQAGDLIDTLRFKSLLLFVLEALKGVVLLLSDDSTGKASFKSLLLEAFKACGAPVLYLQRRTDSKGQQDLRTRPCQPPTILYHGGKRELA